MLFCHLLNLFCPFNSLVFYYIQVFGNQVFLIVGVVSCYCLWTIHCPQIGCSHSVCTCWPFLGFPVCCWHSMLFHWGLMVISHVCSMRTNQVFLDSLVFCHILFLFHSLGSMIGLDDGMLLIFKCTSLLLTPCQMCPLFVFVNLFSSGHNWVAFFPSYSACLGLLWFLLWLLLFFIWFCFLVMLFPRYSIVFSASMLFSLVILLSIFFFFFFKLACQLLYFSKLFIPHSNKIESILKLEVQKASWLQGGSSSSYDSSYPIAASKKACMCCVWSFREGGPFEESMIKMLKHIHWVFQLAFVHK